MNADFLCEKRPAYCAPAEGKHAAVLDTDLGTDDACALLLLKMLPYRPDYIVASYGNTSLDGACRNAVVLKKYLGLPSRIVKGLPGPDGLAEEKKSFHGKDGLAGCSAEMMKSLGICKDETDGVMPFEEFRKVISGYDSVTYITIGPLSNLARLMDDAEFCRKIRGLYIMGGGISEFNCSHDTEFNFSKDPVSVSRILSSGLNVTLFPLDVTNHQRIDAEQIGELEKTGAYPEYIRFLRFNLGSNTEYNGIPAAVLHDALPVLYLSHPEWFELEDMRIASDGYGRTVPSPEGGAVRVCMRMEKNRVYRCLRSVFEGAASGGK